MNFLIYAFVITIFGAFPIFHQDNNQTFYQALTWSPDGKYLSFTGMHNMNSKTTPMKANIYIIKADGSDLKKITGDEKTAFYSSWSRDRIAFNAIITGSKDGNIYTVKKDGTDLVQITQNTGRNSAPSFSPNGKKIVFSSNRDGEPRGIYTVNIDGTNVTRVPNINSFFARFSPDGKKIAFISGKFPNTNIFVADADGSNEIQLTK